MRLIENRRYVIKFWPRIFNGYGRDSVKTSQPKIEEMIYKKDHFTPWCGEKSISSTKMVRLGDVVEIIQEVPDQ